MPIDLPSFENTYCYAIVACGEVVTRSKKIIDILKSKKSFSTTYQVGNEHRWALAIFGGGEGETNGRHFHLEVTSRKPPDYHEMILEHVNKDEFNRIISVMIGKKIRVEVTVFCSVEISELPEDSVVRPRFFKVGENEGSIKTVRMEFEIEGLTLPNLGWVLAGHDKQMTVQLSGRVMGKIDREYISTFANFADQVFSVYVMGETVDAQD